MTDTIDGRDSLENHFGEPYPTAVAAMRTSLDKYQRRFIELSPFACLATADASGQPTISPKGDKPGFIEIIDDNTLVLPDRIGNNKVESFHNLVENPKMALIFMIPGLRETLRVAGEARIITDRRQLAFAAVGKNPVKTGLIINVTQSYFHCGKAMIRSKLWDESSKLEKGAFPSFGEVLKGEVEMEQSVGELDEMLEDLYEKELY